MSSDPDPADHTDHAADDSDHPLAVADPEDYSQNQRLKDIHETRRQVRQTKRVASQRVDQVGQFKPFNEPERNAHVAAAVADFLLEAEPILRRLDNDDNDEYENLYAFLDENLNPHNNPPPLATSMKIYRECVEALANAGLGLELDNDVDKWDV